VVLTRCFTQLVISFSSLHVEIVRPYSLLFLSMCVSSLFSPLLPMPCVHVLAVLAFFDDPSRIPLAPLREGVRYPALIIQYWIRSPLPLLINLLGDTGEREMDELKTTADNHVSLHTCHDICLSAFINPPLTHYSTLHIPPICILEPPKPAVAPFSKFPHWVLSALCEVF